jgi:hypothetical protein
MTRRLIASLVIAALTLSGAPAAAAAAQATQSAQTTPPLPVDVNKIRNAVEQAPTPLLSYDGMKARFYVRVDAKNQIRFSDFINNFDLRNGPVPHSGMTHAEFMAMVTPKELYSAAGIKPTEALEMALTGWLAQVLARKAIDEIKKANSSKEVEQIRQRISKELAALTGAK